MNTVEITPNENTDLEEYRKSICFVSPHILSVKIEDGKIEAEISEQGDAEQIKNDLLGMLKKFRLDRRSEECYHEFHRQREGYYDVSRDCGILFFGDGQIGFDEKGKFLLDYFDETFCRFAKKLGAMEKTYPVLLPVKEYLMTGYVKKSPQHAIFCSSVKEDMEALEKTSEAAQKGMVKEEIKEPEYALSPSACFHVYLEYRDQVLEHDTLITFRQNVFRNEGRLNYAQKGRLRDYLVREIVMIGTREYCLSIRDQIMEWSAALLEELELSGDITLASDSFVLPKMQTYRRIQKIDKSKYEMHLMTGENEKLSVASFNLHGKAFTDPFNFGVKGEDTVTACIGFGLQRFVIAFLSQYGYAEENWPERLRRAYQSHLQAWGESENPFERTRR